MNTSVADITETRKAVTVTVTREEITEKETAMVGEFVKQAKIPGFRPGKAPKDMVRKRFKSEIEKEVQQKVVSAAYQDVIENSDLKILTLVDLAEPDFASEGDL